MKGQLLTSTRTSAWSSGKGPFLLCVKEHTDNAILPETLKQPCPVTEEPRQKLFLAAQFDPTLTMVKINPAHRWSSENFCDPDRLLLPHTGSFSIQLNFCSPHILLPCAFHWHLIRITTGHFLRVSGTPSFLQQTKSFPCRSTTSW